MRETTRQIGAGRKTESDSELKDGATRYRSACISLSYLAQDRLDLAETAKHLAQRASELREFDFVPLKHAARYLVEKPKAVLRYRRQKHVDKITVFVDSDFADDPVSRKSTTGLVAQIGNNTVKSGSTLWSLTALSAGEAEFYAVLRSGETRSSWIIPEIYEPRSGNSNED